MQHSGHAAEHCKHQQLHPPWEFLPREREPAVPTPLAVTRTAQRELWEV